MKYTQGSAWVKYMFWNELYTRTAHFISSPEMKCLVMWLSTCEGGHAIIETAHPHLYSPSCTIFIFSIFQIKENSNQQVVFYNVTYILCE